MQTLRYNPATQCNEIKGQPSEAQIWEAVIIALAEYLTKRRRSCKL